MLNRLLLGAYLIALTVGLVHPQGGEVTGWAGAGIGDYPDTLHFAAFTLLAILAVLARLGWGVGKLVGVLLVYGVVGELVQMVIPGRTASLLDGLANVLGILVGIGVMWVLTRGRLGDSGGQCADE